MEPFEKEDRQQKSSGNGYYQVMKSFEKEDRQQKSSGSEHYRVIEPFENKIDNRRVVVANTTE